MVNLGILYARFVQFGPKLVLVTIAAGPRSAIGRAPDS